MNKLEFIDTIISELKIKNDLYRHPYTGDIIVTSELYNQEVNIKESEDYLFKTLSYKYFNFKKEVEFFVNTKETISDDAGQIDYIFRYNKKHDTVTVYNRVKKIGVNHTKEGNPRYYVNKEYYVCSIGKNGQIYYRTKDGALTTNIIYSKLYRTKNITDLNYFLSATQFCYFIKKNHPVYNKFNHLTYVTQHDLSNIPYKYFLRNDDFVLLIKDMFSDVIDSDIFDKYFSDLTHYDVYYTVSSDFKNLFNYTKNSLKIIFEELKSILNEEPFSKRRILLGDALKRKDMINYLVYQYVVFEDPKLTEHITDFNITNYLTSNIVTSSNNQKIDITKSKFYSDIVSKIKKDSLSKVINNFKKHIKRNKVKYASIKTTALEKFIRNNNFIVKKVKDSDDKEFINFLIKKFDHCIGYCYVYAKEKKSKFLKLYNDKNELVDVIRVMKNGFTLLDSKYVFNITSETIMNINKEISSNETGYYRDVNTNCTEESIVESKNSTNSNITNVEFENVEPFAFLINKNEQNFI